MRTFLKVIAVILLVVSFCFVITGIWSLDRTEQGQCFVTALFTGGVGGILLAVALDNYLWNNTK